MEIHKTLKEWELSRLAEGMLAKEFDHIAMRYLDITKVRLDQIETDAGKNCVTYMANCLIWWRDTQSPYKARQLLYSKLTRAADQGLVERKSFQFLVTGEEDEGHGKVSEDQLTECIKTRHNVSRLCRSCPCPSLTGVILIPIVFYIYSSFQTMKAWHPDFSPLFVHDAFSFESCNSFPYIKVTCVSIGPIVVLAFMVYEICLCHNLTYMRGQRANEQRRDKCRFAFFAIAMSITYVPLIVLQLACYIEMELPQISESDIVSALYGPYGKNWNKIQILYDCCGMYNYTYWGRDIPDSCCVKYKTGCAVNISNIHHQGCLPNVTKFVDGRVKVATSDAQLLFLVTILFFIFLYVGILYKAGIVYYGKMECCTCKRERMNRDETDEDAESDEELLAPNNAGATENEEVGVDLENVNNFEVQIHNIDDQGNADDIELRMM